MKHSIIRFTLVSAAALGTVLFAAQSPSGTQPEPQAQEQGHRMMDPQKQLDHLTKKLALTADQQSQILPILTDRQQQMSAIQSDSSLNDKDRRAKMRALRNDSDSKLRNVLNDTQRASYDEMQQQARDRARAHRQGNAS